MKLTTKKFDNNAICQFCNSEIDDVPGGIDSVHGKVDCLHGKVDSDIV